MPVPRNKTAFRGPSHHRRAKPSKAGDQKSKRLIMHRANVTRREQAFDYFLVIDFECTCEMQDRTWPHEIIEFPAVLMNAATGDIVAEFHRYVRPVLRPNLTPFCINLTGIQQSTVDRSAPLREVVAEFREWLATALPQDASVCVATDGPSDLEIFMYRMAVKRDKIPFPQLLFTYVDVKLTFSKFFKVRNKTRLPVMIREMNLKLEGQHHSGIADSRNIARVMNAMMEKGCVFDHPMVIRSQPWHVCETADNCPRPTNAAELEADDEEGDTQDAPGAAADDNADEEGEEEEDAEVSGSQEENDVVPEEGDAETGAPSPSPPAAALAASNEADTSARKSKARPEPKFQTRDLDRRVRDDTRKLQRDRVKSALASHNDMAAARIAGKARDPTQRASSNSVHKLLADLRKSSLLRQLANHWVIALFFLASCLNVFLAWSMQS